MQRNLVAGRYLLEDKLGVGATSSVYRASDRDGAAVAVKIIHPHVANQRAATERLMREAKAIAKLDHPSCVKVLDWGIHLGDPYVVLELVEGETLARHLTTAKRVELTVALRITIDICEALHAAHAIGIVHRDLKPENVMLLPNGAIKVLDFGLARLVPQVGDDTIPKQLTQPGTVLGTPTHMAPEQLRRSDVDERADIYACGVLLYEILTGELPINADTAIAVIMAIATKPPRPPRELLPDIDAELEGIILRCLEKQPDQRFATVAALRAALLGVLADAAAPEAATRAMRYDAADELPTMPRSAPSLESVKAARLSADPPPRSSEPSSEELPTLRHSGVRPQLPSGLPEATTRRMARSESRVSGDDAPLSRTEPLPPSPPPSAALQARSGALELRWTHVAATVGLLLLVVAALWAIV